MDDLSTRLRNVTVTVTSPDSNLRARVRGRRLDALRFRPGAYQRYREADLAHQLARTATLLFIGRDRAVGRLIEEAGLIRRRDPAEARDKAERRYMETVHTMPVVGAGAEERVRFRIEGMARWDCRIEPGTLRRLDEAAFITETTQAANDLLRRARHETMLAKDEYFNLGVPAFTRERARRAEAIRRGERAPCTGDW